MFYFERCVSALKSCVARFVCLGQEVVPTQSLGVLNNGLNADEIFDRTKLFRVDRTNNTLPMHHIVNNKRNRLSLLNNILFFVSFNIFKKKNHNIFKPEFDLQWTQGVQSLEHRLRAALRARELPIRDACH
jgi:hypothetical protein